MATSVFLPAVCSQGDILSAAAESPGAYSITNTTGAKSFCIASLAENFMLTISNVSWIDTLPTVGAAKTLYMPSMVGSQSLFGLVYSFSTSGTDVRPFWWWASLVVCSRVSLCYRRWLIWCPDSTMSLPAVHSEGTGTTTKAVPLRPKEFTVALSTVQFQFMLSNSSRIQHLVASLASEAELVEFMSLYGSGRFLSRVHALHAFRTFWSSAVRHCVIIPTTLFLSNRQFITPPLTEAVCACSSLVGFPNRKRRYFFCLKNPSSAFLANLKRFAHGTLPTSMALSSSVSTIFGQISNPHLLRS